MAIQKEIAIDYLTRFPERTPLLTLAKTICKENPSVFASVDAARTALRKHCGQQGKRSRASKLFNAPSDKSPFRTLPDGLKELGDWEPYHINCKKALILSDVH